MKHPTFQLALVAIVACKPSAHSDVPAPAPSPSLVVVEGGESYERPPPAPAELDVEQVINVIREAHVSISEILASQQLEYHGGRWYDIVVFTTGGAMYCRMVSPEADQDDCEHDPESGPYIPWKAEDLVGVAVVSYSDPKAPRFERARFLFSACEADDFGSCGEPDEILEDGGEGGSVADISVERLEVADVDGDGAPEVVLETSHVTLDENYQFTATWCEIEMNSGSHIRDNCLEEACASPTTKIQMPYDFGADRYGPATVQQLRPALESCELGQGAGTQN